MAVSKSSAESASTVLEQGARADHLTFVNTQSQAQRHRSTADLAVLDVRLADRGHLVKKRGKGAECRKNAPGIVGSSFNAG